jgi:glutamate 5-kinase
MNNWKRIVVKVGTSSITDEKGNPSAEKILSLARECVKLIRSGKEVILVSSGAIASGREIITRLSKRKDLPAKQALSAVGQVRLMQYYAQIFSIFKQPIAQILITAEDIYDRKRYLNISQTFETLLEEKIIPIVNENDTVAVEEIKIGDNDTLSAKVACAVDADVLIILSDVYGLYTEDPNKSNDAKLIKEVYEINESIEKYAGPGKGTGGMYTKLMAAKIVTEAGIPMILTKTDIENILERLILKDEKIGTFFYPSEKHLSRKKHWMLFVAKSEGKIYIDDGAKEAILKKGKSLLPVGIIKVEGDFARGDTVSILDKEGNEIGKGIINYDSSEIQNIIGKNSEEIKAILGDNTYEEVIHRNNMALIHRD